MHNYAVHSSCRREKSLSSASEFHGKCNNFNIVVESVERMSPFETFIFWDKTSNFHETKMVLVS